MKPLITGIFLFGVLLNLSAQSSTCVNCELIDSTAICPMIYAPVCGCNGVTYSNNCIAINFGGVLSYTDGPCTGACLDMNQFDFGDCDLFLGYAWTANGCEAFSGCGWTYCNVNYQSQFFDSPESCQSQCPSVDSTCISQTQIEQGFLVDCSTFDTSQVCGCNNVTYQNSCHAYYVGGVTSYASGACGNNGCRGVPYEVNFGACAMQLGFVRLPSGCVSISGCSFIGSNGYDYSDFFFTSELDCNMGCAEVVCVDSSLIDPSVMCPAIYDPVCGCNGVTYSNECEATYYGGVSSWVAGECGSACFNPDLVNPDAICPTVIAPVCGCDGNTYENSCYAEIAGITSWTNGACGAMVACNDFCVEDIQFDATGNLQVSIGYYNVGVWSIDMPYVSQVAGTGGEILATGQPFYFGHISGTVQNYPVTSTLFTPPFPPDFQGVVTFIYNGNTCALPYPCNSVDCIDSSLIDPSMGCFQVYNPVCGCDGVTYSNDCYATYYGGVTSWVAGECGSACFNPDLVNPDTICPTVIAPVCGCDGNTYENSCYAEIAGITSWTNGACGSGCIDSSLIDLTAICPLVYDPVCGCDGITYDNYCYAQYYGGVISYTDGACGGVDCVDPSLINLDVICPAVINPVCGCNGITYNNDCEATNYGGVTSWVFGACPPSCDVFCVTNIFFDTTGTLQTEIQFNGQPTEFINYPYVTSILDGSGQIVATGDMWVFGQIGGTSETYPLTSTVLANPLPENFNATVMFTYDGTTCALNYPCQNCVDSSIIDLNVDCMAVDDPVCGCDSVTYQNACVAQSYNGVTSYTAGPCLSTGLNTITQRADFVLYPNPASHSIQLMRAKDGWAQVVITDMSGREITTTQITSKITGIDISALPNGAYMMRLMESDGNTASRVFLVH